MTKTDEQQEIKKEEKAIEKSLLYKAFTITAIVATILFVLILIIALVNATPNKYTQVLAGLALLGLFIGGVLINLVRKTVGFKFLLTLFKVKRLKNKGFGLFKEFTLAGRPIYHIVKFSDIIKYKTKINDENRQGLILYNPYAKYEDFGANIPIVEGSFNDISPKNFFTGNRIGVVPDLADKIIVETGISKKDLDDVKKQRKFLLIGMAVLLGGALLGFDLYSQRLAEANSAALACYKELGSSATIAVGGLAREVFNKNDR